MLPTFFDNEDLRLILFGGKGGTGKTTMAVASALWLAVKHPERVILLVSMDPAHSLSDSLMMEFGNEAKALRNLPNLHARELDASHALDRFKAKHGRELKLIADRGTYFDDADINGFFDLSLPGVDEVMGILEISDLIDGEKYDTIVVDTAPTGHTLQMLRLPALLDEWLGVFDLMEGKHHMLQEHFARRTVEDEADIFLETTHNRLQKVAHLLCNPSETEFVVVTIPEEMVYAETERLLHGLFVLKIPVRTLVINRVVEGKGCPFCAQRELRQKPFLEKLKQKSYYKSVSIPLFPSEIKGVAKLKMFASAITTPLLYKPALSEAEGEGRGEVETSTLPIPPLPFDLAQGRQREGAKRLPLKDIDNARFIMLGGKGGVGKTTTASSLAILLAEKNRNKRYRLYSIDPAHSLGDCFSKTIGDNGISLYPNLNVYELNAEALYRQFQTEYQETVNDLFDKFVGSTSSSSGIDFGYDRELLNELLTLAPPGLDELMALQKVTAELSQTDCIILDTAPTGHFVRFLEMPYLVKTWLNAIFELLLKYRGVVHLGDVAEKIVRLSRDIRGVMKVITDKKSSCVIVVTIPEAMAIAETRRLVDAIDSHGIKCGGMVVNMVTDGHGCGFCAARADSEMILIKEAGGLCKNMASVPYIVGDIRGVEKLTEFGKWIWQ